MPSQHKKILSTYGDVTKVYCLSPPEKHQELHLAPLESQLRRVLGEGKTLGNAESRPFRQCSAEAQ
jgi:hypothetical protein